MLFSSVCGRNASRRTPQASIVPFLIVLLLGGCMAPLPPPPRTPPPPHDNPAVYSGTVEEPVMAPVEAIEQEPEITPPLTRATLPVPPPPRSETGSDDNPYAGQAGPPKGRPPRNFPVPSMAIPQR